MVIERAERRFELCGFLAPLLPLFPKFMMMLCHESVLPAGLGWERRGQVCTLHAPKRRLRREGLTKAVGMRFLLYALHSRWGLSYPGLSLFCLAGVRFWICLVVRTVLRRRKLIWVLSSHRRESETLFRRVNIQC